MSSIYRIVLLLFSFYFYQTAQGQNPVQFRFSQEQTAGNEVLIKIKAIVPKSDQLYSVKKFSDEAPIQTQISFDSSANFLLKDSLVENGSAQQATEPDFNNTNVIYFSDSVEWQQKLQLQSDSTFVKGKIAYFLKSNGSLNNYEEPISIKVYKLEKASTD